MNATDFVLSLIEAFNGHVEGRSLLQRRAYFVSVLAGIDSEVGFVTHYNGPYSPTVDKAVTRLKSLGLLAQSDIKPPVTSPGFEIKLYEYRLTDEGVKAATAVKQNQDYGRIANACQAVLRASNPGQLTLSIAAKAHFTLKQRGRETSPSDIVCEVQKYDSTISKTTLDAAVRFLGETKLDRRSNPN
jgi:uncharacterized protein YwgA